MKKQNKKILLSSLVLGIPFAGTINSTESEAMLKPNANAIKTPVKTSLVKPPLPPKPTTSGGISSKINLFNNIDKNTRPSTSRLQSSVGKLNLNSKVSNNLNAILSQSGGKPIKTQQIVGKLTQNSGKNLSGTFGKNSSNKPSSLDLSKLPSTPPPPPSPTVVNTSNKLTPKPTNNQTSTQLTPQIPDAPPLPTNSNSNKLKPTQSSNGSLKNELQNKLDSGLNKTPTTNKSKLTPTKQQNPQDNLINELKLKLSKKN